MADNKKYLDLNGLGYAIRKMDNKKADIESPVFTGTPAAPTAEVGTSTQQIATTEFVNNHKLSDFENDLFYLKEPELIPITLDNIQFGELLGASYIYLEIPGFYEEKKIDVILTNPENGENFSLKQLCNSSSKPTPNSWGVFQEENEMTLLFIVSGLNPFTFSEEEKTFIGVHQEMGQDLFLMNPIVKILTDKLIPEELIENNDKILKGTLDEITPLDVKKALDMGQQIYITADSPSGTVLFTKAREAFQIITLYDFSIFFMTEIVSIVGDTEQNKWNKNEDGTFFITKVPLLINTRGIDENGQPQSKNITINQGDYTEEFFADYILLKDNNLSSSSYNSLAQFLHGIPKEQDGLVNYIENQIQTSDLKGEKGDVGDTGEKGDRGTALLHITTSPWANTHITPDGLTHTMGLNENEVKQEAFVDKLYLGDIIEWNGFIYQIAYLGDPQTASLSSFGSKTINVYVDSIGNIKGPQGVQGIQGPQGPQGPKGDPGEGYFLVTDEDYSKIADFIEEKSYHSYQRPDASEPIRPNIFYDFGPQYQLEVTFEAPQSIYRSNEYMFQFESPSDRPTTLIMPSSVKWCYNPVIEAGKTYQVSVLNDLAVICGA